MKERALLLYSGGLDTSVMIKWLQDQLGYDVSTLTLNVGQEKSDLEKIANKARKLGAIDTIAKDVTDVFANVYVASGIMSDGLYEGKYPLSTSLARPLMAKEAVEMAQFLGCDTIVHGSTGKGNDQVRFEVSIRALDDTMKVVAPVRDMNMNRDEEIEYAKKNGIEVKEGGKYSVDENLWGRSVEGSTIEDITKSVPYDAYHWVVPPEKARDIPETVSIGFKHGIPVSLNNKKMDLKSIITALNVLSGINGVGAVELIENRVVGIKSHEFYECPAAITLINAHKYLSSAILNKKELSLKAHIDSQFSESVYSGLWFDPVMEHIMNFEKSVNQHITGNVTLKLYKGNITSMGVESPNALYDLNLSGYGRGQTFDQNKAPGFIHIFGNETVLSRKARIANGHQVEIKV